MRDNDIELSATEVTIEASQDSGQRIYIGESTTDTLITEDRSLFYLGVFADYAEPREEKRKRLERNQLRKEQWEIHYASLAWARTEANKRHRPSTIKRLYLKVVNLLRPQKPVKQKRGRPRKIARG